MIRKILLILGLLQCLVSATNPFADWHEKSPFVGAVDKFCSVSDTQNGVCTVRAKTIRLTYDQVYRTHLSMVFENS